MSYHKLYILKRNQLELLRESFNLLLPETDKNKQDFLNLFNSVSNYKLGPEEYATIKTIDLSPPQGQASLIDVPQADKKVFISHYQRNRLIPIEAYIWQYSKADFEIERRKLFSSLRLGPLEPLDFLYVSPAGFYFTFSGAVSVQSPYTVDSGNTESQPVFIQIECDDPLLRGLEKVLIEQFLIEDGPEIIESGLTPSDPEFEINQIFESGFEIKDIDSITFEVTNIGSSNVYPIYRFFGPGTNFFIKNESTGAGVFSLGSDTLPFLIGDDQTVIVDSDPLQNTVQDINGVNLDNVGVTNFEALALQPGVNVLTFGVLSSGSANKDLTKLQIEFYPVFLGI